MGIDWGSARPRSADTHPSVGAAALGPPGAAASVAAAAAAAASAAELNALSRVRAEERPAAAELTSARAPPRRPPHGSQGLL